MRRAELFKPTLAMALAATFFVLPSAIADDRIVAVGDIHGSFEGLVSILQRAGLTDDDIRWVGGRAKLVQTGDICDRGADVRKVLDLLIRLEGEAAEAGGEVVVLIGNHEGMNLTGFYRDVNPEVYSSFIDDRSEKRRKAAYNDFRAYWRARASAMGVEPPVFGKEIKDQWMAAIPLGWLEHNEAFGPKGVYGKWLRKRPLARVIDGVLFIHGGVGPDIEGLTVAEINDRASAEIATYDRLRELMISNRVVPSTAGISAMIRAFNEQDPPDPEYAALADANKWLVRSPEGPLWFRGAARWDEETEAERMVELLARVGAQKMVVGHTVQDEGRIEVRFGGRVFLIDTGMLSSVYQGGRPSALVIENGTFSAVYTDGSEEILREEALPEAA